MSPQKPAHDVYCSFVRNCHNLGAAKTPSVSEQMRQLCSRQATKCPLALRSNERLHYERD